MKKILFAIILFSSIGTYAQNLRLNGYALYAFDDNVEAVYTATNYFEGKVKGGLVWGGGLEYMVNPQYGVELSYLRMDTKAPITAYGGIGGAQKFDIDLAINYLMLGGMRYMMPNPNVELYGGLQMGAAFITGTRAAIGTSPEVSDDVTKFAWGLRGGANIYPGGESSRIGLKLQAALLSAVQGAGGSLYFGTGGVGAGVSTYSTFLQFALGGGLVFKLGK